MAPREDAKVIRLVTQPVNMGVVRTLESLLDMAKKGEILSLVVCGELVGSQTVTSVSLVPNGSDVARLNFSLDQAKMRLLNQG